MMTHHHPSFILKHKEIGNNIFWLKVAYTANNLHYRGRAHASFNSLIEELLRVHKAGLKAVFPYMMLQPAIPDSTETKVIMHNGVPRYFFVMGENTNASPPLDSPEGIRMFAYATLVHKTLADRCPHAILDGLARVDIMKLADNTLVVNEVEGVDSNYSSKDHRNQCETVQFLENYWYNVIMECVKKFLLQKKEEKEEEKKKRKFKEEE
jgi:hypothetical protein